MKKLICIIAAVTAAWVCLTGCGSAGKNGKEMKPGLEGSQRKDGEPKNASDGKEEKAEEVKTEKGHCFHYKGVEIPFDVEAAPVLEKLGKAKGFTEEPSCAFEGLDKTYDYGSFYLQTSPKGGSDHIFCLWFADDSVTTDEGIYIGSPKDEVEKAYGAESFDGTNAYVTIRGKVRLTIIMSDNMAGSIQYDIPLD